MRKLAVLLLVPAVALLTACTSPAEKPSSSTTASATKSPTKTPKPVLPAKYVEGGSAQDNLPYFTWVVNEALGGDVATDSYDVAQKVSESSFAGNPIQYTFSRTAVGLAADSVDVSVEYAGGCLIAQYGKAVPELHTIVLPVLASGGCLLGTDAQPFG